MEQIVKEEKRLCRKSTPKDRDELAPPRAQQVGDSGIQRTSYARGKEYEEEVEDEHKMEGARVNLKRIASRAHAGGKLATALKKTHLATSYLELGTRGNDL